MKKLSAKYIYTLTMLVALMFFAADEIKAEQRYRPHVSIGGHTGLVMSRMSFSPSVDQAWHNGSLIGVSVRYQEEKIFGLLAELNFVQRGWQESFEDNSYLKYKRTINYISLPVMTHINFGNNRFKGFVNLGPEVSLMIGDNISSNFDYKKPYDAEITATRMTEQMYTDISSSFDYGITTGLGAEYYLRPRHSLSFEIRFYYGLGNIYPSAKADTFSASRTMSLSAKLAYNFRLK